MPETPSPPKGPPLVLESHLDATGRLLVPAKIRKKLGINPGDRVRLTVNNNRFDVESLDSAIARVQDIARKRIPRNKSAVDSLIADRRSESGRE